VYEAYGPAGIALIIEAVTDNKNRTVKNLRTFLSRNGYVYVSALSAPSLSYLTVEPCHQSLGCLKRKVNYLSIRESLLTLFITRLPFDKNQR
jgi:hypothetical protein